MNFIYYDMGEYKNERYIKMTSSCKVLLDDKYEFVNDIEHPFEKLETNDDYRIYHYEIKN